MKMQKKASNVRRLAGISTKNVVSYALAFVMAFSSLSMLPVAAYATSENEAQALAHDDILTATLGEPLGMLGFEDDYALSALDDIVEIIVQFVTPPAVALRILRESDDRPHTMTPENQAIMAHSIFEHQLGQLPVPFGTGTPEIVSSNHTLFNGVTMKVPSNMVSGIANLPEVFGVFPNVRFYTTQQPHTGIVSGFGYNSSPDHVFNREARQLLEVDYIHNQLGITGRGVTVAVLDTGIYHHHPRFASYLDSNGLIPGWDFVDNGPIPMEATFEEWGLWDMTTHGTHVSGTVISMAPDVNLRHYRVLGPGGFGYWDWIINGIEAAHQSSDVMNLSLGAGTTDPHHPASHALNIAALDGTVVVVSAGNSGPWEFSIWTPAAAALPITVGAGLAGSANWSRDDVSEFSSRGPVRMPTYHISPDIIAPGGASDGFVEIISAVPSFAVGRGFSWYFFDDLGNAYGRMSGTSMSAPAVAGIVALLLEQNPSATPHEIKARIMNTARPLADADPNVFDVGAGFIDAVAALTRNNAFATVEHSVPFGLVAGQYTTHTMASLSFGSVYGDSSVVMPITIHNAGSGNWTHQVQFNGEHTGVELNIVPGVIPNTFEASMMFNANAAIGMYQGNLVFNNGSQYITMPFAVMFEGREGDIRTLIAYGTFGGIPTQGIFNTALIWELFEDGTMEIRRHQGTGAVVTGGALRSTLPNHISYVLRIVFTEEISFMDRTSLFSDLPNTIAIEGLHLLDMSRVTDMAGMFARSRKLTTLDLSSWDVGSVRTFTSMFSSMDGLTYLNVTGWDLRNAGLMTAMFSSTPNLSSLDLSSWDMSNVRQVWDMFGYATGLTDLNMAGWNTGSLIHMHAVFWGVNNLTHLDLSGWDTRRVAVANAMGNSFNGMSALESITFGEHFVFAQQSEIPAPRVGYWANVGSGTIEMPESTFILSWEELMAHQNATRMLETWVWQPVSDDNGVIWIRTPEDLARLRYEWGGAFSAGRTFVLANDIHLTQEWVPINDFRGTLDGRGHAIHNLYVLDHERLGVAGLFGYAGDSITIKNLGVHIGHQGVNAFSADSESYDSASHMTYAGGLIAVSSAETVIKNSFVIGDISTNGLSQTHAGGLIGCMQGQPVQISNSFVIGNVTAYARGIRPDSTHSMAGGLIGRYHAYDVESSITDSFVVGNIFAGGSDATHQTAGGLVGQGGQNPNTLVITNSYATGSVNAPIGSVGGAGGLVGDAGGGYWRGHEWITVSVEDVVRVINSYRLTTQIVTGHTVNSHGEERTPEEMRNSINLINWDFENIWEFREGYNNGFPVLHGLPALRSDTIVFGDVNNDGVVNMLDLIILELYLEGIISDINRNAADVHFDGVVNMFDLIILELYLNGQIPTLPHMPNR